MIERQLVTQTGNDTATFVELGIPVLDGKSAYSIKGIEAFWVDGTAVAAADWWVNAYLAIQATSAITPDSPDWLCGVTWGMQNTGGVAVAVGMERQQQFTLLEPRVTVQPSIYAAVSSSGTGQANDVIFCVYYEIIRMSELEYLRMLAGGA